MDGRNCLFEDERDVEGSEVSLFKKYSEENCLLECRAKKLLEQCGCLPYYYPRLDIILAASTTPEERDKISKVKIFFVKTSLDIFS